MVRKPYIWDMVYYLDPDNFCSNALFAVFMVVFFGALNGQKPDSNGL